MSISWIDNLRSANWNQASSICFFSYLLGCFTAGYYLVRLFAGEDIREIGSGSVGARNVSRVLGKTGFFFTVLCDFGKGALAVWVTRHYLNDDRLVALALLAVVAGHIWPAQLRFHGGKGMATSLGALAVYDAQLALTFVVLFLCVATLLRRTVLPGLFAFIFVPVAAMLLGHSPAKITALSVLAGMVVIAHRRNLVAEFFELRGREDVQPKPDQFSL
jgi:glycerol-3-phosphate acyltransferase PlsY